MLNVTRAAWDAMLSRVCENVTRKNSRMVHLHFTSLCAASAIARVNEYGGTVLKCIYSRTNQTMFMVVLEPDFYQSAHQRTDADLAETNVGGVP